MQLCKIIHIRIKTFSKTGGLKGLKFRLLLFAVFFFLRFLPDFAATADRVAKSAFQRRIN